jgi:hypothetical protein
MDIQTFLKSLVGFLVVFIIQLCARISTEGPKLIKPVLKEILPKRKITSRDEGFLINATMQGKNVRELNLSLLSALRRIERKTSLRSEWKSGSAI